MRKNKVKIAIILTITVVILIVLVILTKNIINYVRIKNAVIKVTLKTNLTAEFLEKKKVSDFIDDINGKIINDYVIDTKKIGEKKVSFEYINDDDIKVSYAFKVNVVDKTAPLVWLSESYTITKGDSTSLEKKILCADNYDNKPSCLVQGNYDYNQVGTYDLKFIATDQSMNKTEKNFTLNVSEKMNNQTTTKQLLFSDVLNQYSSDNVKVGIDISKWQSDIDFDAIKEAGVKFVMIKVGSSNINDDSFIMDPMFINNITKANEKDIDVGVYFYSKAASKRQAKKEALWVIDKIKKYRVNLPVAFDWENFGEFNDYALSLFGLNEISDAFLNTIKKRGYKAMLYASKNYLENIWIYNSNDVWLAHYTNKTNYAGKYVFWQLSNTGKIDGIKGLVDIDLMYTN